VEGPRPVHTGASGEPPAPASLSERESKPSHPRALRPQGKDRLDTPSIPCGALGPFKAIRGSTPDGPQEVSDRFGASS